MDYQAVAPPTNYGAPNVFQPQPAQGAQQQQGAQGQQSQVAAALAKAKQLLSSGQISADQYSQLTSQLGQSGELAGMGGNMGAGMPQAAGQAAGAPLNIMPGQGG